LAEEIRELLTQDWAAELDSCELIFVSVSKKTRPVLVGSADRPILNPAKLRRLPMGNAMPTLEAVKDAHRQVARVIFTTCDVADTLTTRRRVREPGPSSNLGSSDLWAPLHAASAAGDEGLVVELLEGGGDPTALDTEGHTAYELCRDAGTRRAFQLWRELHEDSWDWKSTGVPGFDEESQPDPTQRRRRRRAEAGKTSPQQDRCPVEREAASSRRERRAAQGGRSAASAFAKPAAVPKHPARRGQPMSQSRLPAMSPKGYAKGHAKGLALRC